MLGANAEADPDTTPPAREGDLDGLKEVTPLCVSLDVLALLCNTDSLLSCRLCVILDCVLARTCE